MTKKKHKLAIAITGASGAIYARGMLDTLLALSGQTEEVSVIFSDNAKDVWELELGNRDYGKYPFRYFDKNDFSAPFASGSSAYDALIVCPCSMGTLGRIASGSSDDLISRTADVMLKERRRLILVVREAPYNLIHINNMKQVTEAGGIVFPASPSFYSLPGHLAQLTETVTHRVLSLAGLQTGAFSWGQ